MMYEQTIQRLLQQAAVQNRPFTLETAHALNELLDFPSSFYPTMHIAGSNGKGSVATKIAKILELSGYRVGLYTSPHLFSLSERIAINGTLISKEEIVLGLQPIFDLVDKHQFHPTFFEQMTFLALEYFRKQKVDVAVLETGLGGRLDATNVIQPLLSIITSISLEHTHVLGEDIEQIAKEKAGIIKRGVPLVIGPKARCQSIYDRAEELECPLFASSKISYFFDEENAAIAELALEPLSAHFQLSPEAKSQGLLVRPPCRFEREGDVIFDVAHNPEAIFSLLQALHHFFPEGKFRFLVSFSKDKDHENCLDLIADVATHIHLVQSDSSRSAPLEMLAQALKDEDPYLWTPHTLIQEAAAVARSEAAHRGEILVVCGSFYMMAQVKAELAEHIALPVES
jgi:dihydrofolate synthase / folylpolyglutamate synthase